MGIGLAERQRIALSVGSLNFQSSYTLKMTDILRAEPHLLTNCCRCDQTIQNTDAQFEVVSVEYAQSLPAINFENWKNLVRIEQCFDLSALSRVLCANKRLHLINNTAGNTAFSTGLAEESKGKWITIDGADPYGRIDQPINGWHFERPLSL